MVRGSDGDGTSAQLMHAGRPLSVQLLVAVLVLLAVGGASGAAMFFFSPDGSRIGMAGVLRRLPVDSFILPGVFLLLVMCLLPATLVYALVARPSWGWVQRCCGWGGRHWSWWGSLLLAAVLFAWLAVQAAYIGFGAPAQVFTAALALVLLVLAVMPSVRRTLRLEDPGRWTTAAGADQEGDRGAR